MGNVNVNGIPGMEMCAAPMTATACGIGLGTDIGSSSDVLLIGHIKNGQTRGLLAILESAGIPHQFKQVNDTDALKKQKPSSLIGSGREADISYGNGGQNLQTYAQ